MRLGVVFPQIEIGSDPAVVRDYVQTAEGLGYTHLVIYDHVLGASTQNRANWTGPYTSETPFHEPFVLFGYLAAITQQLELVTGVIILPQRQTVLVAKQTAEVDVLTGGRLRLGVGIGWNEVEYEGLGENFHNRGKRMEEQIALMRRLWTEPVVTFEGKWHRVTEAGINPLPVQRPIPVWLGGSPEDIVLERIGRLADGWLPQFRPDDRAHQALDKLRGYAQQAGRDPNSIGIEARLDLNRVDPATWDGYMEGWRALGAGYMGVNTMRMGLSGRQHIDMIERFMKEHGSAACG